MPELSVILCAWRPSPGLHEALRALEGQTLAFDEYEVIVVDNHPQARVRPLVEAFHAGSPMAVRYAHEPRLGLSAARNRGVREAHGQIIAFLDDDARAEPGWGATLLRAYDELPGAEAIGGRIQLQWPAQPPASWRAAYNELCGQLHYAPDRVRVGYPRYPYGGNSSFRRSVFLRDGLFSTQLGPVGRRPLDGEEYELYLRLERRGGQIYYEPGAVVTHVVPAGRLSRRFVMRKAFFHGRSMALIEAAYFGRRFALRRSLSLDRHPEQRRRTAQRGGTLSQTSDAGSPWLEYAALPVARPGLKALAQGLGYGWQTFGIELWRRQRAVPPPPGATAW